MRTHEVENLPLAELKARRTELVEALGKAPPADLAARYVQARTDAALRDQTLARQGATITALEQGLAAASERAAALQAQVSDLRRLLAAAQTQQQQTEQQMAGQADRVNRLRACAHRNHAALTGAHRLLNDALAAQQIEDADRGA